MLRTKKSVDRYVENILRKTDNKKAITLRYYNIATLYYQIREYETARRYVSDYLEVKGESPLAHKLLGEIYEALGRKEAALDEYKASLMVDAEQDNLVMRVCELLTDEEIGNEPNRIQYWAERAAEKFPDHPIVSQLKEKMITSNDPSNDDELEGLILSEVSLRSNNVNLRVKLMKLYISQQRMEDAYKHALEVECTYTYHQSLTWYKRLYELLSKLKNSKIYEWRFWVFLVTASERYAALSLTEYGDKLKSINEAAQILLNFDQVLLEAQSKVSTAQDTRFAESMFNHMWGQLNYHLACLLLRRAKREQKNWPETIRLCIPLLLTALHAPIIDPEASWIPAMKHQSQLWHAEGSYRCSQAGHVLVAYCHDNSKQMIDEIGDLMTNNWRDNTFRKIIITFVGKHHESLIKSSYFVQHHTSNPPLRLFSAAALRKNDEVAKQVHPASLHHHVWFGLAHKNLPKDHNDEPYPNAESLVFKGLQYSINNLSLASAESLSVLDLDVFLNITILCALQHYSEQSSRFLDPERLRVIPADLTNNLCSTWQENWWTSAYKIYKKNDYPEDFGQMRMDLQRGLEIVRCIVSRELHINVLVHCGKIFKFRYKVLENHNPKHRNLSFVRERAELFWRTAVPLLDRKLNKQQIPMISSPVFDYKGKDMNNYELNEELEEGQLLLVQFLLRFKQYVDAINVLQGLKRPEAAYYQGIVYKKLAEELVDTLPKEAITPSIKEQHCIMLDKAKSCFYLTLDRLRAPGVDPNHPLIAELGTMLADIEDILYNNHSKLDLEVSDENFISAHSLDIVQSSVSHQNLTKRSFPSLRQSTPRIQRDNLMRIRLQEARPSPERLLAQIRQLVYAQDNALHTIIDQQKALLESNTVLADSNQQLQKTVEDLRKVLRDCKLESNKLKSGPTGANHTDSEYAYDDDYGDVSYTNPIAVPPATSTALPGALPGNIFPRQVYSPLVYQNQGLNQAYPGLLFTDYIHQLLQSFYPPSVYQMPQLYPRAAIQALGVPKMSDMLQQGIITPNMFNSRSMTMFLELVLLQQQNIQGLNFDWSRNSTSTPTVTPTIVSSVSASNISIPQIRSSVQQLTIKYTLINKTPSVNVVITSSDTIPTIVPTVQPTLSIVIPPHHRSVSGIVASTALTTITNSINSVYNTNIANQPNIPYNYQILLPTEAAIPAAIGIPSIFKPTSTFAGSGTSGIGTRIPRIETETSGTSPNRSTTTSVPSTSHNSSLDVFEEHDPIPHFVPVIPLSAEIRVTTKEENEEELFCARAKLFCFVEKEWKDRGVGNVKLLKNKEGRVRLLMRRDQVLKICANHLLTPGMELLAMPNNNRAWIWAANDIADGKVRLEKLCIKFKHVEEALAFKQHFDNTMKSISVESKLAQELQKISKPSESFIVDTKSNSVMVGGVSFSSAPDIKIPPAPESPSESLATPATSIASNQIPLSQLFKPPSGSWECPGCYTRNTKANKYCGACETSRDPSLPPKLNANSGSGSFRFGIQPGSEFSKSFGSTESNSSFSFRIPAVSADIPAFSEVFNGPNSIGQVAPSTTAATVPSFAPETAGTTGIVAGTPGLNFKAPELDPKTPGKDFVFGKNQKLEAPASACSFTSPHKSSEFQLPAISPGGIEGSDDEVAESEDIYFSPVNSLPEKVEVKTGEENENERGLSDIKLLKHQETETIRLMVRREQILKQCIDHFVTKDLEIGSKDDQFWIWNAVDCSGGEIECIQLTCRFKSKGIADESKTVLDPAIKSIDILSESTDSAQLCFNTANKAGQAAKSSSSSPELLYEKTVSFGEKDAALVLPLVNKFYTCAYKDNCSGFMGCNKSSLSPLEYTIKKVDKVTKPVTPTSFKLAPAKLSPSQVPIFSTSNSGTNVFSSSASTTSTASSTPTASATTSAPSFSGNSTASKSFSFGTARFNTSIFGGNVDKNIHTGQQPDKSNKTVFGGEIPVCSPTTIDFGNAHLLTKMSSTHSIFGGNTSVQSFTDVIKETSTSSIGLFSGAKQDSGSKSIFEGTSFGSFGTSPKSDSSLPSAGTFRSKFISASNLNFGTLTIGNWPILSTPNIDLLTKAGEQNDNFEMEITPIVEPADQGKVFGADVSGDGYMNIDNAMTFSSLAANANAPLSGFNIDPNFTFAGAGKTVFGSQSPAAAITNQHFPQRMEEDDNSEYD